MCQKSECSCDIAGPKEGAGGGGGLPSTTQHSTAQLSAEPRGPGGSWRIAEMFFPRCVSDSPASASCLCAGIELNVRLNHKNPNFRDPLLRTMAHDPTLTSLDLGEFKSRGWYDAECTELVVKSMCANLNVTKVSIRFNDVDDADMPHLVALVENQTLTELDLSNNFIARSVPP